jgi:hypothetical protein
MKKGGTLTITCSDAGAEETAVTLTNCPDARAAISLESPIKEKKICPPESLPLPPRAIQ